MSISFKIGSLNWNVPDGPSATFLPSAFSLSSSIAFCTSSVRGKLGIPSTRAFVPVPHFDEHGPRLIDVPDSRRPLLGRVRFGPLRRLFSLLDSLVDPFFLDHEHLLAAPWPCPSIDPTRVWPPGEPSPLHPTSPRR